MALIANTAGIFAVNPVRISLTSKRLFHRRDITCAEASAGSFAKRLLAQASWLGRGLYGPLFAALALLGCALLAPPNAIADPARPTAGQAQQNSKCPSQDFSAFFRAFSESPALQPQLAARGAPLIPSYFAFVREFVAGSFQRSPLGRGSESPSGADCG